MTTVILAAAVLAATIRVPQDYPTIQAAIDAAVAGDTVLVAPGVYVENIDFKGKAITVDGSGMDVTIIDGQLLGSVVSFVSGETRAAILEGFTITHGYADLGAGIVCVGSAPTIRTCRITENEATDKGGGIYADAPVRIEKCEVSMNRATFGGGIRCGSDAEIVDNVITGNEADRSSGGIECGRRVLIEGNAITYNGAVFTAGIKSAGECIIADNVIAHCRAEDLVGGLLCGNDTIERNVIEYNGSEGVGGVMARGATIRSNVIRFNFGAVEGGGVSASLDAVLENNLIAGNVGTIWGGVLTPGRVINCTIVDNEALGHGRVGGVEGDASVVSSIIWGNTRPQLTTAVATYSDIQGGWPGTGNFDADPLFVDPANGDYSLTATSPCVDAGDPADHASGVDLAGNPRHLDGHLTRVPRVDVGAYEVGNVHLAITGTATPGGTVTVDTTGTAGLRVVLLFGTEPAEAYFYPYGPLFFALASPWTAVEWGQIPSSVQATIPADVPVPLLLIVQEVALDDASGAGNASNAVAVTIE